MCTCAVCSRTGFKKLIKYNLKSSTIQNINEIKNGQKLYKTSTKEYWERLLGLSFLPEKILCYKKQYILWVLLLQRYLLFTFGKKHLWPQYSVEDLLLFETYEWLQTQNMYECLSWNMDPWLKFLCKILYTYMHGWDIHICVFLSVYIC